MEFITRYYAIAWNLGKKFSNVGHAALSYNEQINFMAACEVH